jgi:hypothetical protein
MSIEAAKAQTGRDTIKGESMNKLEKNRDSYKVTATGHSSDSGTTDSELDSAASSLYSRAAANSGGRKNSDPAIQDR